MSLDVNLFVWRKEKKNVNIKAEGLNITINVELKIKNLRESVPLRGAPLVSGLRLLPAD